MLRLAQITSGHIKYDEILDPDTGDIIHESYTEQIDSKNPKVELVVSELSKELKDDPLSKKIIWCYFREDTQVMSEALRSAGIGFVGYHSLIHPDHRQVDAMLAEKVYNCDPSVSVFLGNIASAAEGLNLLGYDRDNEETSKTYTDHMLYVSENWSSVLRSQSEDRAHRRKMRMPLRISDVVVPGTIDTEMRAAVKNKITNALSIQDVRDVLDSIMRRVS
jgi:hypothetical protein